MHKEINKLYGVLANCISVSDDVNARFSTASRLNLDTDLKTMLNQLIPLTLGFEERCAAAELVIQCCRTHEDWPKLIEQHDAINTYDNVIDGIAGNSAVLKSISLDTLCERAIALNPNSATYKKQVWFTPLDHLICVGLIILERL